MHRRSPEKNAKLFMNSTLSPMRKSIIKAYFRDLRVANATGLTIEQVFHIYFEVCHTMSHVLFSKLMTQDSEFKSKMVEMYLPDYGAKNG